MSALDKMAKMYFYPEKHNKDDISKINSCLLPEYMLDIAFKILDTFVF